jgi:hypothetical protein
MAQKLDEKELVTFKEMLMANSIMVDALVQILMAKGLFTEQESVLGNDPPGSILY